MSATLDAINTLASNVGSSVQQNGLTVNSVLGPVFNLGKAVTPQVGSPPGNQLSTVNEAYVVTLYVKGAKPEIFGTSSFKVKAYLPQNFSLQFGSSWSSPLDKSFAEGAQSATQAAGVSGRTAQRINLVGSIASLASTAFGTPNRSKLQTAQVWQNGQPMSINIPFHFAANTSTYDEVQKQFKLLSKLASPSEERGLLYPPGPYLSEAFLAQGKAMFGVDPNSDAYRSSLGGTIIGLKLGEFAYIEPIIVESVDSSIDTINDKNGKPMFMAINVQMKTYYTVTATDIDNMLNHKFLAKTDSQLAAESSLSMADPATSQFQQNLPLKVDQVSAASQSGLTSTSTLYT